MHKLFPCRASLHSTDRQVDDKTAQHMTRSIKSCLKGCVKQHPISLNVDCSVKPSKMQTLQKFISTASFKKSSAVHVQEPASPTHVEVLPARRVQEDMLSSETAGVKVSEANGPCGHQRAVRVSLLCPFLSDF